MNSIPVMTAPVLMYHEVTAASEQDKAVRKTNPAYCVTLDAFRRQMEHLAAGGFRSLSLDDLMAGDTGPSGVVITFDDGWDNNHGTAWPILTELGLTATIFVVSGFMGQPDYLTWEQVRELADAGISIQSHTVSHRPLGLLADGEIRTELEDSKKAIEDRIGRAVNHISMPQGVFDRRVIEMAAQAGYRSVSTSEPGVRHRGGNPAVLGRINVSGSYDLATFGRIVAGDRSVLLPMILNKKAKNFVKSLVGYGTYRKLYRFCYRIDDSGTGTTSNP
ncbi:polysaccharide deacetylase family protein [Geobacter hydrogenophilus]|uniref:Polysaccharide deacetylase YxkH n=2 Tax=Geobacter hydrogenophilus TaxID=40983 RepID=A0A9W6G2J2_9BACT|nr:polysaccharide deacetylase family protein [Geobacter hydrogenophilus]GLI39250.1 putative polysaccharide deacetylase YxkH [Geobacter hydrogenophilus]